MIKELENLLQEWLREAAHVRFIINDIDKGEGKAVYWADYKRLRYCIRELQDVLKKAESKQPETAPFANTMFGEVPPGGNDEQAERPPSSFMGATRAVRQNEQTKEPCPVCRGIKQIPAYAKQTKSGLIAYIDCPSCGGTGKAMDAPAV